MVVSGAGGFSNLTQPERRSLSKRPWELSLSTLCRSLGAPQ
jgi:hypothetical protein